MSDNFEVHILLTAVLHPEKKKGILFITEEQCFHDRMSCWASLAQKVSLVLYLHQDVSVKKLPLWPLGLLSCH